jgi:hypothetical protein
MARVGEAEGGGVTRLEQRGGVAIAFMAAAYGLCCDVGHVDSPNGNYGAMAHSGFNPSDLIRVDHLVSSRSISAA